MGDDITPAEPPPPQVPAGWLDDPEQPDMYRYWDGAQWTENRSPKQQMPPPSLAGPPLPQRKTQSERFAALPTIQKIGLIGVIALGIAVLTFGGKWYGDNVPSDSGSSSNRPSAPRCETVVYRITGTADSASITMEGISGTEQRDPVTVPFRHSGCFFPNDFTYISAQNNGEFGTVECEIVRGGEVVSEATSRGAYVIATCSD